MLRLVSLIFILCLSVPGINAQQTTQSAPSRAELRAQHDRASLGHVVPQRDFEQFAPYWTAEGGWHTELQLRNNLVSGNLVVTPSLRTADGTETALNPITLLPGEVQSVDLNKALAAVNSNLAGQANAYGSIVLRYNSKGWRNLYASVMVHDSGHPIMYHIDAVHEASKYGTGSREGIWWLPTKAARDYLILTNKSNHELQGTLWLYDDAGKPWNQPFQIGAKQTQRLSVRQLLSIAGFSGRYGGIKIEMPQGAGSLDTAHIVFDEVAGFSATMKMFDYNPNAHIAERDFAAKGLWLTRAPMLALSHPDPVLAFPAKTVLRPQLLIRNSTAKPAKINLSFHWRNATKDGHSSIPELTLSAFETRRVDVQGLQNEGIIPLDAFWSQVTMSTNTLPNEVMAVAASYDATLRYGAQTPFSDQLIAHLEGGQWQVDANHTSLIAAGNGGNKPVQAALTFFYDQGRKQYRLERTISADDQWWVDIGQLIRSQIPDKNGNILPADLNSGAYQLREISEPQQDLLYEGKVVTDKTYGHATYGCMVCCGYGGDAGLPFLIEDPTGVEVAGLNYADVYGANACTGNPDYIGGYFPDWSSFDTSILTAALSEIRGVAPGSTTINAQASSLPSGDGEDSPDGCPFAFAQGMGGGNVSPTITFGSLSAVAVGGSASVAVSFSNSATTSPVPITLTLTTSSGSGSATFAGGGTTMTITAPTTVTINGVTASSTANNLLLDATVPGPEGSGPQEDATNPQPFTAVSVSLTLQMSGPEAVPNSYLPLPSLGVQVSSTYVAGNTACLAAFQITGQITPSNYQGSIYLRRTVTSRGYTDPGAILNMSQTNQDDTSLSILEATKNGMIYDLDGPAVLIGGSYPVGNSSRLRANFDEYAVLGSSSSTTKVSTSDLLFYARVSCQKASSISVILDTTYPSDNQIGLGTTNLSDNLR